MLKSRLVFVPGLWQLIVATAALSGSGVRFDDGFSDHLVIYGHDLAESTKKAMAGLAAQIWQWESATWIDDLSLRYILERPNWVDVRDEMVKRVGHSNPDEIWVSKLFYQPEQLICEAFPNSSILLYEDGLHSYVPQVVYPRRFRSSLLRSPKQMLKHTVRRFPVHHRLLRVAIRGVFEDHLERVSNVTFFLDEVIPLPSYLLGKSVRHIQRDTFLSVLHRAAECIEPIRGDFHLEDMPFMLLGQCFSRYGLISWDEELRVYQEAVSALMRKGYTVIWKEHPRATRPFSDALLALDPRKVIKLPIPQQWPVELFVERLRPSGCAAATSTILFYLPQLFQIPSFRIQAPTKRLLSRDHVRMGNLVRNQIPLLDPSSPLVF